MTIYSAAMTLFLVMDPLGNIPIFLHILNSINPKRRIFIVLRESCIAFSILTLFLLTGEKILDGLNITKQALGVAGGIILFLIAIKMIFPNEENSSTRKEALAADEPLIVPMAIPLLAGPSSISMVMLLANESNNTVKWFAALALASLLSTATLLFAIQLRKVLGKKGLVAIERLMGMLLTVVAVQMLLTGLKTYLH